VILLDTHALIWLARAPEKLSRKASDAIRDSAGGIAISAMTLWEVAFLAASGRLQIHSSVEAFVERITSRVAVRPVSRRVAVLATQFPETYPRDPIDKLIGATALSEGMRLVTKDREIRACKLINTVW
jgi:PIN domain nuclease of toxin-antitoxin system